MSVELWLDSYEDIFSDFDPRSYAVKELSDDFVDELLKQARRGKKKITLFVPKKKRTKEESLVKKRISEFFLDKYEEINEGKNSLRKKGFSFIAAGVIFLITLLFLEDKVSFGYKIVITILEPASWFLSWEGLNLLVFDAGDEKKKGEKYKYLAESKIVFVDEETLKK